MRRIPQLAFVLETIAAEVISAVHTGFSAHLPRSRRVHARYLCRLNLTEYGECEYRLHAQGGLPGDRRARGGQSEDRRARDTVRMV